MIEAVIISYLQDKTAAEKNVYAEIPKNAPSTFIVIEKTGSNTENRITTATIAIKSYAGSLIAAASLNEEVKVAMDESPVIDDIASCKLNSDYNFTDSTAKQYRYQAVFQITHY